jgi:hypothetical protein
MQTKPCMLRGFLSTPQKSQYRVGFWVCDIVTCECDCIANLFRIQPMTINSASVSYPVQTTPHDYVVTATCWPIHIPTDTCNNSDVCGAHSQCRALAVNEHCVTRSKMHEGPPLSMLNKHGPQLRTSKANHGLAPSVQTSEHAYVSQTAFFSRTSALEGPKGHCSPRWSQIRVTLCPLRHS